MFILVTNAQQVQWASKLVKFSSDLGGKQNGIKRILGKPDAYPQAGLSPNAWSPKNALDGREIIIVGFDRPQSVKQIAVFENANAGCVVKISVDNGSGNFKEVWSPNKNWSTPMYKATLSQDRAYYFGRKRRKIQEAPQSLNPGITNAILKSQESNVVAVKIDFNFGLVPGQKQIDAIGISDTEMPIEAVINTNTTFQSLSVPQIVNVGDFDVSSPHIGTDGKLYATINKDEVEKIIEVNQSESKLLPTEFSENDSYNYLEYISSSTIIRGGASYVKNSEQTGYDVLLNADGKWIKKEQIKIAAFNNYNETSDFTATPDLKTIVLAIETDFTQGSTDLYFANNKNEFSYGFLQNMGKAINTAAEEATPQLLSDTKTLLFASNGFSSFGNYDLFVSYRLDETWKNWSEPINLGNKINSSEIEISPFYDEKKEVLYFTRNVEGKLQLLTVNLPKISLIAK